MLREFFFLNPYIGYVFKPACPRCVEFHVVFSPSVLESGRVSSSEFRVTSRFGKYAFCVSLQAILESNRWNKTPARATLGSVKVIPLKGLIPSARPQANAVTTHLLVGGMTVIPGHLTVEGNTYESRIF